MKRLSRYLPLILLVVLAAILLSGCSSPIQTNQETGKPEYNPPGVLEIIAGPMRSAMVLFHTWLRNVSGAWGWAIILVAALIRLLLLPLGIRQMRSMRVAQAKMQAVQPELDALKKKYAKDKQKLQAAQMELYQKHGIMQAQMAGCLPTLLQMPILIAFYYALMGLVVREDFQPAPFYFIPDLAYPAYGGSLGWLTQNFSLQKLLQGDVWPYVVLPIVLAVTQYVMTKMSQSSQPAPDPDNPAANMMGQMALVMTAMFVFFSLSVPSGVSLYWAVGNLLAMAQQYYVNRQKLHWAAAPAAPAAAPAPAIAASDDSEDDEAPPASSNGRNKYTSDAAASAELPESAASPRRKRRRRR